ncbi:MAG: PEP/pyruvate-binding domain-containing protein [Ignavibacteria bacterium]|nr:PEP/pyruvate-binding domain-containing protein [Ignavibacteria bacterium]
MTTPDKTIENLIFSLQERTKELNCLYLVEEVLSDYNEKIDTIYNKIVEILPTGFQYPELCVVKLTIEGKTYKSENFKETEWKHHTEIEEQDIIIGSINIYYTENKTPKDKEPFLKEEYKLIETIADRIGSYITHRRLKNYIEEKNKYQKGLYEEGGKPEWLIIVELLKDSDQNLYRLLARKMMNYLCWNGIKEAERLLYSSSKSKQAIMEEETDLENKPLEKRIMLEGHDKVFSLASYYFTDDNILSKIQKWIQEEKSSFLVRVMEDVSSTINDITEAVRKYHTITPKGFELPKTVLNGLNVSFIRRFLSDELNLISIVKNFVNINDFELLLQKLIYLPHGRGKIGGKSVGLFIAEKIIRMSEEYKELFKDIKVPNTWYIASDVILEFLRYNDLEEVFEQKYKDLDQIRHEYPYIIQIFKNSVFPPEIVQSLSTALDDFGENPLIVRSSSLLEDRLGAAFSGKYKSLFVANQGEKKERLNALMDAIAEVYASVFAADPIEYRRERGLLDYNEEMGILIQEVVGTRVGKYYLPAYAGVAFSNNEFRWSPRIKREDGLIRLVPGLGTRAVDRVSDDYPVLIAPGKPGLRVNISVEDVAKYSPQKVDVINLLSNTFETIEISELLKHYIDEFPALTDIMSTYEHNHIRQLFGLNIDANSENLIVTFDKLTNNTDFLQRVQALLKELKENLKTPVDIEFASDGKNFYLLQCRPQSYSVEDMPSPIPKDIPRERIIFSAKKYVSNGKVPDITHIVYIDPDVYNDIPDLETLKQIGRAVGKLNKVLPKHQFILMGPGRWGSRGDIKLGVNVTYSEINNTSMLIEIAKKKGNYVPDLSFGTHFFQDLVEASIRYLPLYPDDPGIVFNYNYLLGGYNILPDILPEYENLSNVLKVIDVPKHTKGMILKVLMNADLDEAIAYLSTDGKNEGSSEQIERFEVPSEDHWQWRFRMTERIAAAIDPEKYGVKGFYIIGSTKNATAGPNSDIDVIVHIEGDTEKEKILLSWLEGWSNCLSEMNYLKTGYKVERMLDIHVITDEDVKNKTSFAVKIGAVTDAARELPLKQLRDKN